MELIEGKPLKGPLALDQALRYAAQICDALDAAHKKNITHRDLKPANILVTASGVKLLDFGLAKMAVAPVSDGATETMALTEAGAVMGTAAYMSPEQAKGEEVDARSDIFSFGVVLYEMLSGRPAFARNSSVETMSAILRDEPAALDAPAHVSGIIMRCLRKSRTDRFQTMSDVRTALDQAGTKPVEQQPSIAVLPFVNMSADKENEYFSDGLAEEILNALSQVEGLKVAARTSSFFFKGKALELSEVASKLRVATVLEGSVRRAGSRVRVTVQLVDVKNGFHLWSERYDRQMEDIFDVQDEIARAIAERFKMTLAGGVKRSTQSLDAYELYLKGRHHWHQRSLSTIRLAIQCFEQTIQLDPDYALAYAGLADCYGILVVYGWMPASEGRIPAEAAMTKSLALAPELWEVNYSRAFYQFYFERHWHAAEPYFQKAIDIHPRSALAQVYFGMFLAAEGRAEDSIPKTKLACQLDPLSPIIYALAAGAQVVLGRFEEAQQLARRGRELQPDYLLGLWIDGLALSGLGRNQEAIQALEHAVHCRAPRSSWGFWASSTLGLDVWTTPRACSANWRTAVAAASISRSLHSWPSS